MGIPSKERTVLITSQGLSSLTRNVLTKGESYVLWHLVAKLPLSGAVLSHVDLGKELSISNVKLGGVLKHLCEAGFLVRGVRIKMNYHYELNPLYFRII